jgi:anti-sigma factor RsiW
MPASHRRRRSLSAYLDGELSPRWQAAVARALKNSQSLRTELQQLARVKQSLQTLPRVAVPTNLIPIATLSVELDPLEIDALLLAYAYGELDPRTRASVDQFLVVHPTYQTTLRDHQRVAKALRTLPRKTPPPAVLAVAIDRLQVWAAHQEPITTDAEFPTRSSWGEYLSAYLDGELSTRKVEKIQERLTESPVARDYLSDLTRIQSRLAGLPKKKCPDVVVRSTLERIAAEASLTTPNHFERVPAGSINIEWPDDTAPAQLRPKRTWNWPIATAIAASVALVVALGTILSGIPLQVPQNHQAIVASPRSATPAVEVTNSLQDRQPDVGQERLRLLAKANKQEMARQLDSRRVTVAAKDVQRFLDELGPIGDTLKRSEPTPNGGRLIELTGEPNEIAELLARLADTASNTVGIEKIDISDPTNMPASNRRSADRLVVAADKRFVVDWINSLDRGIKSLGEGVKQLAEAKRSDQQQAALAANDNTSRPSPLPNEPVILARPLRFLLIVSPTSE